jgi:hypothetical protein
MKLPILITSILISACTLHPTQALTPPWEKNLTRDPIGKILPLPPCRISYELSWNNLVTAGTAKMLMQQNGPFQLAHAEAGTTGLARSLWTYDCDMTSVIRLENLQSHYMQHTETDARETVSYRVAFGPTEATTETKLTPKGSPARTSNFLCPYGPLDDLQSAILYVRSQPLKDGDRITRVIQPFDRPYLVTFIVSDHEKRTIQATTYPTIKLDVKIRKLDRKTLALSSFKKVKSATLWVSDDSWRLPVEAHADIFAGYVSATMTKREALPKEAQKAKLPTNMSVKKSTPTVPSSR